MNARVGRGLAFLVVAGLLPACGSGGSGSPFSTAVRGLGMSARGGRGSTGAGGKGSTVAVIAQAASDIRILSEGSVDTAFVVPSQMPNLGANPRTISGAVTYAIGPASLTSLPAGATSILGDDGASVATGLWIQPGASLTLPCVTPGVGLHNDIDLSFSGGVLIEGTLSIGFQDLTVAGDGASNNAGICNLSPEEVVLRSGAVLQATGKDVPGGLGGNGGQITINTTGTIATAGSIDVHGGGGSDGGASGSVQLISSAAGVFNSGPINASGGSGTSGGGGGAGLIVVSGSNNPGGHGPAMNSAALLAPGGDGPTGGGQGGIVQIDAGANGGAVNSGSIDVNGGTTTVSGTGGNAGTVVIAAIGGSLRASGAISAHGGNGAGGGGAGGNISLEVFDSKTPVVTLENTGGLLCGASLDVSGGDGPSGGNAGTIGINCNTDLSGTDAQLGHDPLILVGYSILDASGGSGGTSGGVGGLLRIQQNTATLATGQTALGGIHCDAALLARGGDATAGSAGGGGQVDMTIAWNAIPDSQRSVTGVGGIDVGGGKGSTLGGAGGTVIVQDHVQVSLSGGVRAAGGDGGTGAGGVGGLVEVQSDGTATLLGPVSVNGGGSTTGPGGQAGGAVIQSGFTTQIGGVNARGGTSSTGSGGIGGVLTLFSTEQASDLSGNFSVAGGGGSPGGASGQLQIDGMLLGSTATY